jgi:hypothetical protein
LARFAIRVALSGCKSWAKNPSQKNPVSAPLQASEAWAIDPHIG